MIADGALEDMYGLVELRGQDWILRSRLMPALAHAEKKEVLEFGCCEN